MLRALTGSMLLGCLTASAVRADSLREPELQILQPGVSISLVADHPDLATPTGIDVDSRGRIWVIATHTHFRPDDYVGPQHDEVLVFSDADGDGQMERRQVFYNATDATMDLELGPEGWVYLAERDRILRIRDSNNDGQADVEEDIAVLTTEAIYPHNGLEGLAWHPDGDLVFGLGENFAKPWTLTGTDGTTVSGTGEGGIFRCAADGTGLKRIARGFWNPFGICVRMDGEIFAAENDPGERPPCRLLHVVEGGDYGYNRRYGSEAHHPFVGWNGELRGTLPMVHPVGEAPCAVVPLGRGLLVPSWSDHRIDYFALRREGAGYTAERIALVQGSRYFRPACMAEDRSRKADLWTWYLTDWVDGRYNAHGFGRLWKLRVEPETASWTGERRPEPLPRKGQRAAELRRGEGLGNQESLLQLAQDDDPFLARAALNALATSAEAWTLAEVSAWSDNDRIHAALALKIAESDPQIWISTLLSDANADVQFEALRWIADSQLTQFQSHVGAYLNRSDLDYRRFEAAVATWNTLNGHPESGIRNPELLLARLEDPASDPRLQAFALRLLPTEPDRRGNSEEQSERQFPEGLNADLLKDLLARNHPELSLEVVRTLATNPVAAPGMLEQIAADSNRNEELRAEAVSGLSSIAELNRNLLLQLVEDTSRVVRDEALRCLRSIELSAEERQHLSGLAGRYSKSSDSFQAILVPGGLSAQRPEFTDTEAWLATLADLDGPPDPDNGRRVFHHHGVALCANCHRHNGRGNTVGPDLSRLGDAADRRVLLQSILEPSRRMAPEYQPRTIVLKDGRTFHGIRLTSSTSEAIRDERGHRQSFSRDEIESMVESSVSFMPKGLADSLTLRELRDLIAFLEQNTAAFAPERPER